MTQWKYLGRGVPMKGRICIVDHNLASRGYLRECLEREGHQVVILDSAFQIKPFLSEGQFNLFILDIETPGVKEKSLLLEIKKTQSSRVLMIVSERGDPFLKEAIDLGVYGFIYKPFNLDEICMMVNCLIR
jgi:two-component system response regulator PilR (NtrC family)